MTGQHLKQVMQFIYEHHHFMVCSHINPDGDALGTTLGLGLALREMGKAVTLYNAGPIAYNLKFLPGVDQVVLAIPEFKHPLDATIIVDCGSLKRIGPEFKAFLDAGKAGTLICVDHHATNTGFGGIDYIEPTISSSGEVAASIIHGFRHPFSHPVATALFCALMTDTGSFHYDNTRSATLRLASQLVEAGANPKLVSENLYERRPKFYFHLFKDVLATLELHETWPIAWVHVDQDTLQKYGYDVDVLEGVIEEVRSLEFCEVAIFYKQNKEKTGYKLSLRSKHFIDVAAVCAQFGGGGHHRAAGVDMKGSLNEIQPKVIQALEQQFQTSASR